MKQTLITRLTEVLASKNFKNITDTPVSENEKILREATDSEKAILTLMCEEREKVDNLIDNRGKNISHECDGVTCGCAIRHHLKSVEVLKDLFWQEVHESFAKIDNAGSGLGIRKDFQIVSLSEEEDDDFEIGMAILSGIFGKRMPGANA